MAKLENSSLRFDQMRSAFQDRPYDMHAQIRQLVGINLPRAFRCKRMFVSDLTMARCRAFGSLENEKIGDQFTSWCSIEITHVPDI